MNATCVCGHRALDHGACICSLPKSCIDHLGCCIWCGCSIFEENPT